MIYGIGTDLIREARMAEILRRHPRRFAQRLLHPEELAQFEKSRRRANFLAKAWAAKEAFGKALGTGVRGYANPDVGVARGELGRPRLVYSDAMRARLEGLGIGGGHVSFSDENGLVIAFVVLETRDAAGGG
ncbi:MAG: holo-ACP synthase [Panacagrimonas sp.]